MNANTFYDVEGSIPTRTLNLLILEDNIDDVELLIFHLEADGLNFTWKSVASMSDFEQIISPQFDVILADYKLPQSSALDALRILQEKKLDIPLIVVTGSISEEVAVNCLKKGAVDYLLKDRLSRLMQSIIHATEQFDLRRKQRRTQEQLGRIFNVSLEIILLVDSVTGQIVEANPALYTILGYKPSYMIGAHFSELLALEERKRFLSIPERFIDNRIFSEYFRQQDGTLIPMDITTTRLEQPDGSTLLMMIHDASQRERIEQARLEATQMMLALQKERELREANMRFISMITHDIRNPLTSMNLLLGTFITHPDRFPTEERVERYESLKNSVQDMNELISDMLIQLQMKSDNQIYKPTLTDFVAFSDMVVNNLKLHTSSHTLNYESASDKIEIWFDANLMRRVFENLINNAIKYSPHGSRIDVVLSVDHEQLVLMVADQGIGIPEADQQNIFTMFHRAENAQYIRGTGLGLANVKEIVGHHNGSIHFESDVDVGTKFFIQFPIPARDEDDLLPASTSVLGSS